MATNKFSLLVFTARDKLLGPAHMFHSDDMLMGTKSTLNIIHHFIIIVFVHSISSFCYVYTVPRLCCPHFVL